MAIGIAPRSMWQRGEAYEYLLAVERPMFAWEWLRRTARYRRAYRQALSGGRAERARLARGVGLVELPPPELRATEALPVWRAELDPRVVAAVPIASPGAATDRLDIRHLAGFASVSFDDEDVEHWRIGKAERSVRLDIREGTLLGGPTMLRFELDGLATLRPKLAPLDDLIRLAATGRLPSRAREARAARWIAELRTADALAAGATQQEIARSLFGAAVAPSQWRAAGESYRLRAQRLARAARARLASPLAAEWFQGVAS